MVLTYFLQLSKEILNNKMKNINNRDFYENEIHFFIRLSVCVMYVIKQALLTYFLLLLIFTCFTQQLLYYALFVTVLGNLNNYSNVDMYIHDNILHIHEIPMSMGIYL